jgi:hypothetical protein
VNEKRLKLWRDRLRSFAKANPSYLHLRFPMRVETPQGSAYSPTGILCNLHAEDTNNEWELHRSDPKKIPGYCAYLGAIDVPPEEVADWLGVGPQAGAFWSVVHGKNDWRDGLDAVADYIDALL